VINIKVGLAALAMSAPADGKSSDQTWSMSFQNCSSIFIRLESDRRLQLNQTTATARHHQLCNLP
jgi:hypothetical protein